MLRFAQIVIKTYIGDEMSAMVPIVKEYAQGLVPSEWRGTFSAIVASFIDGDFTLTRGIEGVRPITIEDAVAIETNISEYGGRLVALPDDTWQSSVCQWMDEYWEVLVDLYTQEEGRSDLVLHARVYEDSAAYRFDIDSVYVP